MQAESISTGDIYVTYRKERPCDRRVRRHAPGPACSSHRCMSLMRGNTQHMPATECWAVAGVQTRCSGQHVGPSSIVQLMECAPIHRRRTVEVDWM